MQESEEEIQLPSMSLYIDEEIYAPLKSEAQKKGKDLYRFVIEVLQDACSEARRDSEHESRPHGWTIVNSV